MHNEFAPSSILAIPMHLDRSAGPRLALRICRKSEATRLTESGIICDYVEVCRGHAAVLTRKISHVESLFSVVDMGTMFISLSPMWMPSKRIE